MSIEKIEIFNFIVILANDSLAMSFKLKIFFKVFFKNFAKILILTNLWIS